MRISDWSSTCALPISRAKSVVHSGHGVVTKLDGLETPRSTGTWFHGQVLDSNERVPFGTFLTKSPIGAVFPCTSGRTRPRCTDLSTCGVDKGKTPGATVTCVRSEEHTSELQSLMRNSYAVFCLKKKKNT